jgi:lipoprotein-anchoring transpeptidase ErfK/SrfK
MTGHLGPVQQVLSGFVLALAVLAPWYAVAPAASAASATTATTASTVASAGQGSVPWTLRDPFSREIVRRGDVDADPYHIEHVYEVQYRLKRLGLFDATPNGRFGPTTEAAVKKFQKRNGLERTGTVNYRTWQPLIKQTIRGKHAVPHGCRTTGWHACYNRWWHQVNLYHDGRLFNSWLVRGGGSSTQTRTGTFRVYYRDIDHVSSTYGSPMPYSQFFSGGQALHGSRLMMSPYVDHSHGCVNFWTEDAQQLWNLTSTKTLWVHVYGRWS